MRSLALSGLILASLSAADGYGYGGTPAIQPFLGVEMSPPSTQVQEREGLGPNQGVQVQSIFKGTSADKAGISPGDVILAINGAPISSMSDLRNEVSMNGIGDPLEMTIARNGQQVMARTEVQAWPPSVPFEPIDAAAEQRFRDWQERRLAQAKDEASNLQQDVQRLHDEAAKTNKPDTPEQRALDRAESDADLLKNVPGADHADGWKLAFRCLGETKAPSPGTTIPIRQATSTDAIGFRVILSSTTPDADLDTL